MVTRGRSAGAEPERHQFRRQSGTWIDLQQPFPVLLAQRGEGANGHILATGQRSVLLDMNTLLWASKEEIATLRGARFSSAVTIPIANNSLTSSVQGAISGGGGFGDLYFQPVILSWRTFLGTLVARKIRPD